jgi:hypothetical protein
MDYSKLSDDQIRQMLGAGAAAPASPQRPVAPDYRQMSDDQIRQMLIQNPVTDPRTDTTDPANFDKIGPTRPFKEIVEDVLTRAASSATFGTIEKASAKLGQLQGRGTYEELLAKRRAETEAAGQRLGTGGALVGDILGGAGTASGLARAGLTVTGHVPQAAAGNLAKIAAGTVEGGLYGAAQGAGHVDTGTWKDVAKGAAQGAVPGMVLGGGLSALASILPRAITPNPILDPERERLNQVLRDEGIRISAAQKTGSPNLAAAEDAAKKLPFSSLFGSTPTRVEQSTQVARAAADKAGVAPGRLTTTALDDAFDNVGATIGSITQQFPIAKDPGFFRDIAAVQQRLGLLSSSDRDIVRDYLRRMRKDSAAITPEEAQAIRSDLRNSIQTGPGASAHFNQTIFRLRDTIDDALERTIQASAPPQIATATLDLLRNSRQQYANLHILSDALARSGSAGALGRVTPTALAAALKSDLGKVSYMRGRGQLSDLAKASEAILPIREGSQTAERGAYYNPAKLLMTAPLNLAINSRLAQGYLGNQLVQGSIPQELMSPAIGGLLAPSGPRRGGLLQ